MKIITQIKLFFLFLGILPPIALLAQHEGSTQTTHHHDMKSIPMIRYKFYSGIGGTLYGGELTGHHLFGSNSALKGTRGRPALTVGAAYKINDRFSVRAEIGYCFIKGVETNKTSLKFGRQKDNFQFRADNYDMSVMGQFNILPHTYLMTKKIHIIPYLVLGIGITTSRPKGWDNEKANWVSLHELTNGQVKNKLLAMLPFGFGGVYRIDNQWEVGLDATWRYALGSLDGDSRKGVNTSSLSAEGKAFFDQYYPSGTKTVLKDNPRFHDLYTVIQIRLYYTIVPEKFKHVFAQKDINFSNTPKDK